MIARFATFVHCFITVIQKLHRSAPNKGCHIKQNSLAINLCYIPFPVVSLIAVQVPAIFRRLFPYVFGAAKLTAPVLVGNVPATGGAHPFWLIFYV